MKFRISLHALQEIQRRNISLELLNSLLEHPQQVLPGTGGRKIYQSQVVIEPEKVYLIRAIVDDRIKPPIVLTAYRTKKVRKYWRES
jgi:hypothetical protein